MLGLGDIVFPGVFVAMLLRFDHSCAKATNSVPRLVYYYTGFAAYVFALIVTGFVLYFFQMAQVCIMMIPFQLMPIQPVMLYIVPACLIFTFTVALVRGEFKTLMAYSESEEPRKES